MSDPKKEALPMAKLTLPDGKVIDLPILMPRLGAPCIDIRSLQSYGYYTYDPGFTSTASCSSSISYIDGNAGLLMHRGYRIEDLAANCTYLEVCYLLLNGELPTSEELNAFQACVLGHMMLHEKLRQFFDGFKDGAHPMAIMVGVVGSLSAFYAGNGTGITSDHAVTTLRVIAKLPTIAAMAYKHSIGQPYVYPKSNRGYAENFLHMMFATPFMDYEPPIAFIRALDLIFLLHADHEQNASTTTVRIAGSSDANPLACIAAAIASLWGPLHGGANEAAVSMLRSIGTIENVPGFLEKVKSKELKLMGFGHRVYKNTDPRAKQMKVLCDDVLNALGDSGDPTLRPLLEVACALEKAALEDSYFIKRKLFPNVDFYSGLTLTAMGIPTSMFTVLFAIGRSAGWIAQWKESVEESQRRISRPRQLYNGEIERPFETLVQRDTAACEHDSNAIEHGSLERQRSLSKGTSKSFLSTALKRQVSASEREGVVYTTTPKLAGGTSTISVGDTSETAADDTTIWGY